MKKIIKITLLALVLGFAACTDLDVKPVSTATSDVVFSDPSAYKQFLAKLYAGLAIAGQSGGDGNVDISGIDGGFSGYIRVLFNLQVLSTDEAVVQWGDTGLPDLHLQTWSSQNPFVNGMFNRIYFQVSMANEFLRQTTDEAVNGRAGVTEALKADIKKYRAEARFLRALAYWNGMDLFGNIPIVPESNPVGSEAPGQPDKDFVKGKTAVFNYIESELKAIEADLSAPKEVEYPRADQAAAWMLLAKLYLNAEVYLGAGSTKYTECLTYLNKIIDSGKYSIQQGTPYKNLFLADNNATSTNEFIFAVAFDGTRTQTWGGTTFLVHCAVGGNMNAADYGIASGGWAGYRATKNMVNLFDLVSDGRALFYTNGQSLEILDAMNFSFKEGYAIPKFQNVASTGAIGSNSTFVDTDFPMFRYADVYLMYAEAVLRGGTGGSLNTALGYVNELRQRAYGNTNGNKILSDLTLDFIIDERGRELYWECHRRTDLIRFGLFTTSASSDPRAIWPWKGNVVAGQQTDAHFNVYPIPALSVIANPKLVQNTGY